MALKIGRLGYLGFGIETTPGTPVAATTAIPFTANTLNGKHTPLDNIAAYGSRAQNANSVEGKHWTEGDITVNADSLQLGYLLKLATGNEAITTIQAGVYDHLFFTTYSGNQPLTATLYNTQGVDMQQIPSVAVDKLDFEVKDSLMTVKAGLKGFFPTTGAFSNVSTSGTLFNFTNYSIQFGNNLVLAGLAAQTPITDFSATLENNADVVFESGNMNPSRIFWKQLKLSGSFTMFFETVTQRDNYYNLNKQSLILTASGMALPGSTTELLTLKMARLEWSDQSISTGLEDFFAIKTTFIAEVDTAQGKQYDITLRNYKSSAYA
jgi:hypothetical protein